MVLGHGPAEGKVELRAWESSYASCCCICFRAPRDYRKHGISIWLSATVPLQDLTEKLVDQRNVESAPHTIDGWLARSLLDSSPRTQEAVDEVQDV